MSAILREEPPDLSATNKNVQPGPRARRAPLPREEPGGAVPLGARPRVRPRGAFGDLGDEHGGPACARRAGVRLGRVPLARGRRVAIGRARRRLFPRKVEGARRRRPTFKQLTFRKGAIWGARFGSDGKSDPDDGGLGREARADLRQPAGEPGGGRLRSPGRRRRRRVPVGRGRGPPQGRLRHGLHARRHARPRRRDRGAPRASCSRRSTTPTGRPTARTSLIVRVVGDKCRLEFPAGKVLYETTGWIGNPAISPKGDRIAFMDHPVVNDDGGSVAFVDLAGKKTTLSPRIRHGLRSRLVARRLEVWYTAAEVGGNRTLYAVDAFGQDAHPRSRRRKPDPARRRARRARAHRPRHESDRRDRRARAGRRRRRSTSPGSTGA